MQASKISFVKTTDKDWSILLELEKTEIENQIYRPITQMAELKKYFSKSFIYKVLVNEKLAGYCSYDLNKEEAEVTALLVLKSFRKKGLGELMLKKLLEDLKSIYKIKVTTSPNNTITLRLYLKYGFIIKEWVDNYWKGKPRLILYRIK